MRLFFLLTCLVCYTCNTFAASSDAVLDTTSNALPVTVPAENKIIIKPKIIDDELYSETFSLFADLNDGQYIYAQIGVTNIGPGDNKGLCRIMIFQPENATNKTTVNYSIIADESTWQYNDQPSATLTVGKSNDQCTLSVNAQNHLIFNGHIKDASITINLKSQTQQDTEATKSTQHNKGQYFSEIIIPWGRATSTFSTKNSDNVASHQKQLNGFGYADHSISTLLPGSIASRWIRFRGINAGKSQLLLVKFLDEKQSPKAWLWQQNKSLTNVSLISENTNDIKKNKMPNFAFAGFNDVKSENATSAQQHINAQQLIYRHAPLEEKGLLGKVLSKLIGNPVTYIYRATINTNADGTNTTKSIKGILEVSYANE